ncbi:MAG: hypothetical protein VX359_02810 [Chloroflexota bacterium]
MDKKKDFKLKRMAPNHLHPLHLQLCRCRVISPFQTKFSKVRSVVDDDLN